MVRVALVDDHAIYRQGLRELLSGHEDIKVIGEGANGRDAIALARSGDLDALVMDLAMGPSSGLDALAAIRAAAQGVGILVLTAYEPETYALRLLRMGVDSYLSKDCERWEIVAAIRCVAAGRPYVSERVMRLLGDAPAASGGDAIRTLTERELQVFLKLARGQTISEVAQALSIAPKSVSHHRRRLLGKLGLSSTGELTHLAVTRNLLR